MTREFEAARRVETAEPARALAIYLALVDRHPEFAEGHFRAARLFQARGSYAEANQHYIAARDLDGYPMRCPVRFQDAYRLVARRHGCILIDGPAVLRKICPHGILDDTAINDVHHPSLLGYVGLSQAVLEALRGHRVLGWTSGPVLRIDVAEAGEHFKIDRQKWANVCGVSASTYGGLALIRYDSTERAAKQARLMEARRRIAAGLALDRTGVPGIGVPAPLSTAARR